jgi:hypothetical protein
LLSNSTSLSRRLDEAAQTLKARSARRPQRQTILDLPEIGSEFVCDREDASPRLTNAR